MSLLLCQFQFASALKDIRSQNGNRFVRIISFMDIFYNQYLGEYHKKLHDISQVAIHRWVVFTNKINCQHTVKSQGYSRKKNFDQEEFSSILFLLYCQYYKYYKLQGFSHSPSELSDKTPSSSCTGLAEDSELDTKCLPYVRLAGPSLYHLLPLFMEGQDLKW